ncbi:MAG: RidA family protein [Roseinatronobacter sp.]|nr:MAG: RidA family protein [Roseinatronobacter sp.]
MPPPRLTKAVLSNVLAALKEQGMTPSQVSVSTDGTLTCVLGDMSMEQANGATGPKKWRERK